MPFDESMLSPDQKLIADHDTTKHGRVQAGPGTGKSLTAIALLGKLQEQGVRARMLTFTRAATAEFADTLAEHGLDDVVNEPSTVASYALTWLLNLRSRSLPQPIRIADSWEVNNLVHEHQARLLRKLGHRGLRVKTVGNLEREMSAQWEDLNGEATPFATFDPALRDHYMGLWDEHRRRFGYTLLAELSFRATEAIEDLGGNTEPDVDFLIVDEFQDLNSADIAFIEALSNKGVRVMAIGDEDQSIYGFRYADPKGIRDFDERFTGCVDYTLTETRRFGANIVAVASALIGAAPDRTVRPPLRAAASAVPGIFAYLCFRTGDAEAEAIARIASARLREEPSAKVAVLVRTQADTWAGVLRPVFARHGLTLANVEWVKTALESPCLRAAIALGHLAYNPADALAWWALVGPITGTNEAVANAAYEQCGPTEGFAASLKRLRDAGFPDVGPQVGRRAGQTMAIVERRLETARTDIEAWRDAHPGDSWTEWVIEEAATGNWLDELRLGPLSTEAIRLLELVRPVIEPTVELTRYLSQLEPKGADEALKEADGVRLMTMSKSKGLTFDTAIVVGVEFEQIPFRDANVNEERRLLYVALTRARTQCYATMATSRTFPTARIGIGDEWSDRSRCPFLVGIAGVHREGGEAYMRRNFGP